MPPPLLFSLDDIDLNQVLVTREQVYQVLPHAHEFQLIDGVNYVDRQRRRLVAYHDVRQDEWWVRGHIPGRPLFPGVLMIETAAQVASYYSHTELDYTRFMAFGGVEGVKFREAVIPPCRLLILGQALEVKPRRTISMMQGVVEGRLVFEGKITGLPLRD